MMFRAPAAVAALLKKRKRDRLQQEAVQVRVLMDETESGRVDT